MSKIRWEPTENFIQTFIDEEHEPEIMHVIQSGIQNTFIIVFDDALGMRTGHSEVHSSESFETKFGFKIKSKSETV